MSRDYLALAAAMIGEPRRSHGNPDAWLSLERALGVALPNDYKALVDLCGPVQINGHLFVNHPATSRWNLGKWIDATVTEFRRSDFSDIDFTDLKLDVSFGGPTGLIPLLDADGGEYVFGLPSVPGGGWRMFTCDGDKSEFYPYQMEFSEWLYRYLTGEAMFGPGSEIPHSGPVIFESMPLSEGEVSWCGPAPQG